MENMYECTIHDREVPKLAESVRRKKTGMALFLRLSPILFQSNPNAFFLQAEIITPRRAMEEGILAVGMMTVSIRGLDFFNATKGNCVVKQ